MGAPRIYLSVSLPAVRMNIMGLLVAWMTGCGQMMRKKNTQKVSWTTSTMSFDESDYLDYEF